MEQLSVEEKTFLRHRIFNSKYTHFHVTVFILTFTCQLLVVSNRKALGVAKPLLTEEWTPSSQNISTPSKFPNTIWNDRFLFKSDNDSAAIFFLGALDSSFMLTFSICSFLSGFIAERYSVRYCTFFGILGTVTTIFLFANVGEWFHLYHYVWYLPIWILNGVFQSITKPCLVAIMGNWFCCSGRGFFLGLWSTHHPLGTLIGSVLVASLLNYGYEVAMFVPATLMLAVGVIFFFGIVTTPSEVGLPLETDIDFSSSEPLEATKKSETSNLIKEKPTEASSLKPGKKAPIYFFSAMSIPGVIFYSLSLAFAKAIHYGIFFWLPMYLNKRAELHPISAGEQAAWYDVGSIIGCIAGGIIIDNIYPSVILLTMLLLAFPINHVLAILENKDSAEYIIFLALFGVLIGGAQNLMSSAVPAVLGRHHSINPGSEALATVTGIIEGIGYLGATLGLIAVPFFGWQSMFKLFIVFIFFSVIFIMPAVYTELQEAGFWKRAQTFFRKDREKEKD